MILILGGGISLDDLPNREIVQYKINDGKNTETMLLLANNKKVKAIHVQLELSDLLLEVNCSEIYAFTTREDLLINISAAKKQTNTPSTKPQPINLSVKAQGKEEKPVGLEVGGYIFNAGVDTTGYNNQKIESEYTARIAELEESIKATQKENEGLRVAYEQTVSLHQEEKRNFLLDLDLKQNNFSLSLAQRDAEIRSLKETVEKNPIKVFSENPQHRLVPLQKDIYGDLTGVKYIALGSSLAYKGYLTTLSNLKTKVKDFIFLDFTCTKDIAFDWDITSPSTVLDLLNVSVKMVGTTVDDNIYVPSAYMSDVALLAYPMGEVVGKIKEDFPHATICILLREVTSFITNSLVTELQSANAEGYIVAESTHGTVFNTLNYMNFLSGTRPKALITHYNTIHEAVVSQLANLTECMAFEADIVWTRVFNSD